MKTRSTVSWVSGTPGVSPMYARARSMLEQRPRLIVLQRAATSAARPLAALRATASVNSM